VTGGGGKAAGVVSIGGGLFGGEIGGGAEGVIGGGIGDTGAGGAIGGVNVCGEGGRGGTGATGELVVDLRGGEIGGEGLFCPGEEGGGELGLSGSDIKK